MQNSRRKWVVVSITITDTGIIILAVDVIAVVTAVAAREVVNVTVKQTKKQKSN